MKSTSVLTLMGLMLGYMSTATAALFNPDHGPVYFQFTSLEQVDIGLDSAGAPTNSTTNRGIAEFSTLRGGVEVPSGAGPGFVDNDVSSAGTPPQFADQLIPTTGNQITALSYGITQASISHTGTVVILASTGGFIDLYYDEPGLVDGGSTAMIYSQSNTPGNHPQFTDGIFLGRLEYASGIDPSDATTFIAKTIDTGLANDSGSADAYANVVDVNGDGTIDEADGAWASILNSDWFGTAFGTRDVRFSNKLDLNPGWDGDTTGCTVPGSGPCVLGLRGNDPGRAFSTHPAPEPDPDLDTDSDGILDSSDNCPTVDATGYDVDADGCIDSLRGLMDLVDQLVREGEIPAYMRRFMLRELRDVQRLLFKRNICGALDALGELKAHIDAQRLGTISRYAASKLKMYADSVARYLRKQLFRGGRLDYQNYRCLPR